MCTCSCQTCHGSLDLTLQILTGFPVSSSNNMKDLPTLISSDFLQMTPLSKQSTFSDVTLSITSALLCGEEAKRHLCVRLCLHRTHLDLNRPLHQTTKFLPSPGKLYRHRRSRTADHQTSCNGDRHKPCTWTHMDGRHTGSSRAGRRYKGSKASVIHHQLVPT